MPLSTDTSTLGSLCSVFPSIQFFHPRHQPGVLHFSSLLTLPGVSADATEEGLVSHDSPNWRDQSWMGSPSYLCSAWPTTSLGVSMTPPFSGLIIHWNESRNLGNAVLIIPVPFITEATAQNQPDGREA